MSWENGPNLSNSVISTIVGNKYKLDLDLYWDHLIVLLNELKSDKKITSTVKVFCSNFHDDSKHLNKQ